MSWLFASGGQSIGASASVLLMTIHCWFPLGLPGLISLLSKGLCIVSSTTVWKHQFFSAQPSLWSLSHPYMTTGKTIALTIWIFFGRGMSLLFNTLSRFVLAFLSRSKHLLISWLSLSTLILEPKKMRVYGCVHFNLYVHPCTHRHNQDTKQFHSPLSHAVTPQTPGGPLLIPDNSLMSCKWNHTICNLLRLVSFTDNNAFETHPSYCMYR